MQTKTRELLKSPLLWGVIFAVVALVVVAAIILHGRSKAPAPAPVTTESVTETTLPQPDANPIEKDAFAVEGEYLTCLTHPSVVGIDVSEWQGEIDWQQVKAAGVEFAMIRVAWRGYESGALREDALARTNYQKATEAGIKVGVYVFSQAVSVAEAREEAALLLDITRDWKLEMPVVFDWEHTHEDGRTLAVDRSTLTDCTKAFCDAVRAAGRTPMVYFNVNHARDRIDLGELKEYPFWLAYYDTQLDFPYKVDMWQYTQTGAVDGITGDVDINLYFPTI